jgi:hypothetical protein
MNLGRRVISWAGAIALVGCLGAQAIVLSPDAASARPPAATGKKCKRKHHGKKRHCKQKTVMAPAVISISPASQDFGVPQIGGETRTFTVTNVGGSLSGLPVPMLTQSGSDFSVAANGCTSLLSAGGSCPIDVHVGTSGAGQVSANLTVSALPGGTASASMTANIEA